MSIKTFFETTTTKIKIGAKKAWNWITEHPDVVVYTVAAVGGAAIGISLYKKSEAEPMLVYVDPEVRDELSDALADASTEEEINKCTNDYFSRNWKDEWYRENWDKVNEFAKTLTLLPGESFWIEEPTQYDAEPDEGSSVIVSHLVYGDGVYPPNV